MHQWQAFSSNLQAIAKSAILSSRFPLGRLYCHRLLPSRCYIRNAKETAKKTERNSSSGGNEGSFWSGRNLAIGAFGIATPMAVYLFGRNPAKSDQVAVPGKSADDNDELLSLLGKLDAKDRTKAESRDAIVASVLQSTKTAKQAGERAAGGTVIPAKYLLIGGGPASYAAMESIRSLDPKADILMVSADAFPPYLRPPLSKEIWFNDDETKTQALEFVDWHGKVKPLAFQPESFYQCAVVDRAMPGKVRLILKTRATKLDLERKQVTLQDGRIVAFEKVLLAMGADSACLFHIPEGARNYASTFRSIDDFRKLDSVIKSGAGKHVAIIGGGFLGSELAVSLAHRGKHNGLKITQIYKEEGNMGNVFPRYLSQWTTDRIKKEGVEMWPNSSVAEVRYPPFDPKNPDKKPVTIVTEDKRVLEADYVVFTTGVVPSTDIAAAAGLEIDQNLSGILANAELQARNDVFAAGDVISFYDTSLGMRRRVEHFSHAIASGRVAGANMVGPRMSTYTYPSMFWSELGPSVGYEAVGLVDSSLATVSVWAKAMPRDSPSMSDLDPSDIRTQVIGTTSERDADANVPYDEAAFPTVSKTVKEIKSAKGTDATQAEATGNFEYGKGVVFYTKDQRIVGILMFNLFNRTNLAWDIIRRSSSADEIRTLIDLFNIHEAA